MTSATTLSAEQTHDLTTREISPAFPTTSIGKKLAALGYDADALRFERCPLIVMRKCPNGHIDRRKRLRCEMGFVCDDCAKKLADERLDNWAETLQYCIQASHHPDPKINSIIGQWFNFVELRVPMERSKQAIRNFLKSISDRLLEAVVSSEGGISFGGHFKYAAGFEGGSLVARILVLSSDLPSSKWKALFPEAPSVEVLCCPTDNLLYHFRKLVSPLRIADPMERVAQEILFKRVQKLRASGIHTGDHLEEENEEDENGKFSVEDIPTENFNESEDVKHSKFDECRVCGKQFNHESRTPVEQFSDPRTVDWVETLDLDP